MCIYLYTERTYSKCKSLAPTRMRALPLPRARTVRDSRFTHILPYSHTHTQTDRQRHRHRHRQRQRQRQRHRHTHTCTRTYTHVRARICTCTHTHKHANSHAHTQIHIYIHVYMSTAIWSLGTARLPINSITPKASACGNVVSAVKIGICCTTRQTV